MAFSGKRTRVSSYIKDWMPTGDETPSYKYHVFTSSGTLTVTTGGNVEVLSVGGGGGGGRWVGGGGGGGEVDSFGTTYALTGNVTVTIGAAGTGSTSNTTRGGQGGTTSFGAFTTSLGGGGGGSQSTQQDGGSGGSGGGGYGAYGLAPLNAKGGTASGSNTFAGGDGNEVTAANDYCAGGGGGATAVGGSGNASTSPIRGGNGGQGMTLTNIDANLTAANFPTTLTGMTHIASGGGGGAFEFVLSSGSPDANYGVGGTGGGNGENYNHNEGGTPTIYRENTAATMYGAGGGGSIVATNGSAGYAGLVIVRYLSNSGVVATGGDEVVANLPA